MSYEEYVTYHKLLCEIMSTGAGGVLMVSPEIEHYFQLEDIENLQNDSFDSCMRWCPPVFDPHVRHWFDIFRHNGYTFIEYKRSRYEETQPFVYELLKFQNRTNWIEYMPDLSRGIIIINWTSICCPNVQQTFFELQTTLKERPIVLFSSDGRVQVGSESAVHCNEIIESPTRQLFANRTPYPCEVLDVCPICGLIYSHFLREITFDMEAKIVEYLPENIAVGIRELMECSTIRSVESTKYRVIDELLHNDDCTDVKYLLPQTPFENYRFIANLPLSRIRLFII